MRYVAIIVYGCASLVLFALGAVMGFVGFASVAWLLTASVGMGNAVGIHYAVGVVAAILFGVLFAYPFFVDFRAALEAHRRRGM